MSYQLSQYLLKQRKSSFISDLPPGQFQSPAVLQKAPHTFALILCCLQGFNSLSICSETISCGYGLLLFSTTEDNRLILSLFISCYPSTAFLF